MPCSCDKCLKRQSKTAYRKPAKICEDVKTPGVCCVCNTPVYRGGEKQGDTPSRGTWHTDCAHEYNIQRDANYARGIVFKRDKGICAKCGQYNQWSWDLDHITPLKDGGGYGLDNMQTLCKPCHKEKTIQENKERRIVTKHEA